MNINTFLKNYKCICLLHKCEFVYVYNINTKSNQVNGTSLIDGYLTDLS